MLLENAKFHNVFSISPFSCHATPLCLSLVSSPRCQQHLMFSAWSVDTGPASLAEETAAVKLWPWHYRSCRQRQLALYMIIARAQTVFTWGKIKMLPRNINGTFHHSRIAATKSCDALWSKLLIIMSQNCILSQQLMCLVEFCVVVDFLGQQKQPLIVHQRRHNISSTAQQQRNVLGCARLATHYL